MHQVREDFEEVTDRLNILRALIRDRDLQTIFERHINFDHAERIGAEVLVEPGFVGELLARDTKFIGQDLENDPGILLRQQMIHML